MLKPHGVWGPKEFAQFTDEELHDTMMDAQPGSNYFEWAKAALEHRDRLRATETKVNISSSHNAVNERNPIRTTLRLREDARWKYGVPPAGNANYAWLQHILWHLAPNGTEVRILVDEMRHRSQRPRAESR